MLEAAPDMKRESEKEWYFGNADKERRGPFSFEEVYWIIKMLNSYSKLSHSERFSDVILRSYGFSFSSLDEGILDRQCRDSKDTLLGSRNGWLAPPAGHSTAEMVPFGHWTGGDE